MAKARSPEYPAIGLKEAIEHVSRVYLKDYQNRLPRAVMAEHMGYKGLNGASLPILAALGKYGLLEGRGDETRVSDLAVAIIAHEIGTRERAAAIKCASALPDLFAELDKKFPDGKASDPAIRSLLLTQKFIPEAADTAIRAYRETKELVNSEAQRYSEGSNENEEPMQNRAEPQNEAATGRAGDPARSYRVGMNVFHDQPPQGMRREVITLDEGDVVITFPENLSANSFGDLKDHLELFVKKLQRRIGTDG